MNEALIRRMPEGFGGLGSKDVMNIHPYGLAAVIVLGCAMLLLPRRWSLLPMMIIACFIPLVQKIVVFSLDFNLLRIMVLFGVARIVLHDEVKNLVWKPLDTALVLWVASAAIMNTLLLGTGSAFVNRLGFAFDAIGMYFVFRVLIANWLDVDRLILGLILISVVVAVFFLIEGHTGRNMFSVFGGVREFTAIRQGRLRCQGAFAHPILAGCFWAVLLPLFAAQWWRKQGGKLRAVVGVGATLVIVGFTASSTPVFGVIAVVVGGAMFYFRRSMRAICWGTVLALVALHIVMKAPVWALIARVSAVSGSTSYHRYKLIDSAIRYLPEWFLLGTRSTAHWGWGLQDVTNHFVLEGVRGGFLTLVLFVAVIVIAFREVGRLWRTCTRSHYELALSWALGVSLFAHCMCFLGVAYFSQIYVVWYLTLGLIGSMGPGGVRVRSQRPYAIQNGVRQGKAAVMARTLTDGAQPYYGRRMSAERPGH